MIGLLQADFARAAGELERARELYARRVDARGFFDPALRAEIALDFSEVLLQREFRTAALYQARRAARLLADAPVDRLVQRAEVQIARCLAARDDR